MVIEQYSTGFNMKEIDAINANNIDKITTIYDDLTPKQIEDMNKHQNPIVVEYKGIRKIYPTIKAFSIECNIPLDTIKGWLYSGKKSKYAEGLTIKWLKDDIK